MIQAGEAYEDLKEALLSKDKTLAIDILEMMQDNVKDDEYVALMMTPANLKELHTLILDNFKINPKMLQLKNRVTNRHHNAYLFMQTMKTALSKAK